MASCFKYTLKKCGSASSDAIILDEVFASLSSYDVYNWFNNWERAIEIISIQAYNSLKSALISKGRYIYKGEIKTIGSRFNNSNIVGSGYHKLSANGVYKYSSVNLRKVQIMPRVDGVVRIYVKNEIGIKEIFEGMGLANSLLEIEINKIYKSCEVGFENKPKIYGVDGCGGVDMIIHYSEDCDIDAYICENKELFASALNYKVASMLITEGQFSGGLNNRIIQDEDYRELKEEYETQYELQLRNLTLEGSGCIECRKHIKQISILP